MMKMRATLVSALALAAVAAGIALVFADEETGASPEAPEAGRPVAEKPKSRTRRARWSKPMPNGGNC